MIMLMTVLVGANTVVCRYLNAVYARYNGLPMGTLANYVTGLATSLLVLLMMGQPASVQPIAQITFRTVAMFLGGAVGVGLIQLSIYITPRMPAFLATLLIFLSQLGVGLALDFVLTGDFSLGKLLGGLLVLLGLAHYAWANRRDASAKATPVSEA
ncbi:MAG TPA: DMT family transporter [Candidatus Limiplasma sp.]|mgnify:CR=1 FL=1|nr:DMT family transporter [Candidatus Limiplasma sp.]